MWNQWSGGPPPMPPSAVNPQQPLIGPVQPNTGAPPIANPAPPPAGTSPVQPAAYPPSSGAPSYTPAQYAAMTPEQQYAVQQHWQQWQAYEQQYAQWHAQYGEQYKREMAAIHGAPPPTIPQYNSSSTPASALSSFGYPPPAISNQYQAPPVPAHAPPPPPPDDNASAMGIKASQQIYEQPPPPPPPPQPEDKQDNNGPTTSQYQGVPSVPAGNAAASQFTQGQESRWSQPPPIIQNQGSRWSDTGTQQERQQNQFNQRDRQQQNQFNQRDRQQQNQLNQPDRQQQNQFNQEFSNNSHRGRQNRDQRDQQRDDQGRDNRQGNRQNSDFRGRNRGRGGSNFESNRQPQFDDSEVRNNRQQSWQQSEGTGQRNIRGNYSNRFDNYDNYNSSMGQNLNQQGSSTWNHNNPGNISHGNDTNQGNNFCSPDLKRQQQQLQNQSTPISNPQNNTKTTSVDEKAFDEQFRLWEEQFENWKKENANHPDRTMYMQYEQEFEKTRIRLLERREQMRRRKMMELQQAMPQQPPIPQKPLEAERSQGTDHEIPEQQVKAVKEDAIISETKQREPSDMEQSDNEDTDQRTSSNEIKNFAESQDISEPTKIEAVETNKITDLFKIADGGIPGLDLVEPREEENSTNPPQGETVTEVIDLDNDGPTRPAKVSATTSSIATLLPSTVQKPPIKPQLPDLDSRLQTSLSSQPSQKRIPSLFDIVVEKPVLSPEPTNKNESPARDLSPTASKSSKAEIVPGVSEAFSSPSRSISKDCDLLASPGQRPLSQLSSISQLQHKNKEGSIEPSLRQPFFNQQQQQTSNFPPQTADLAKALQDPNVMQLLTVALAQAQRAGGCNPQQNQLIQQLQQLQPLLQMQQDRNSNNQPWNNPQSQRPQQPWQNENQNQNQYQNQNSNNKLASNSNQNRNSWGSNPFNKNNDRNSQLSQSRGPVSGNESDDTNDMQQRNPHNPFRRSVGGSGLDDNSGINQNLERNFEVPGGQNPFNNNSHGVSGLFGGSANAQQNRAGNFGGHNFVGNNFGGNNFGGNNFGGGGGTGGGRFDNNRPQSNFGNSLGFRNNPNNFGDRGGDDNDYYRPTQVFDYQNRSRADAMVLPAKVVDYGHRPSAVMTSNSFNRDISEFVPVKTIDYGHASNSVQNENKFQRSNLNSTNNINRLNQSQQTNQGQLDSQETTETHGQLQFHNLNKEILSETLQNKNGSFQEQNKQEQQQKQNPIELIKQINKASAGNSIEQKKSVENEHLNDLEDENMPEYPNNKWILQNPENRQRPGPPTKRGKRNAGGFQIKQKSSSHLNTESDEIEENFEEISDNEDLSEIAYNPPANAQLKAKSLPLFPSVSDSISNKPIVFPSMENNNTIPIDEILFKPGRLTRPKHIVIIIRGPPGSGKSHVAKLIKDKEVEMGGPTPRLLSIDDYFMIENDYVEKCPKTGRKIPKKEILYEYEKEMEDTYMQYLIKSFKKTVTDHLFDFIIVDCCNHSLRTFNEFYNAARDGNFSPFIIDMICDVDVCLNQNIHNRTEEEIKDIIKSYQDCPGHYIKLDVSNLLENVVEMEDVSDLEDNFVADSEVVDLRDEDDDTNDDTNDNNDGGFLQSKWDTDPTTENLARLDGTSKPISKRGTATLEEYLQIDGWEPPTSNTNGKKRVRWADIEEKRAQDKMRAIGFVVGQTDWNRMMDPTSGSGALTKTKYIERLNKRR